VRGLSKLFYAALCTSVVQAVIFSRICKVGC